LQDRISVFQNGTSTERATNYFRGRYFMKTVGEANCNGEKYRGGSEVYGESIYTKRWELLVLTNFLLPKNVVFLSYTDHDKTLFMVIFLPS
jgi:outer membrane receptor for ferrienterochelin and colicins